MGKDMPNNRRARVPGGTWFFTVNLLERRGNDLRTGVPLYIAKYYHVDLINQLDHACIPCLNRHT
jgi:hypothetical protein